MERATAWVGVRSLFKKEAEVHYEEKKVNKKRDDHQKIVTVF